MARKKHRFEEASPAGRLEALVERAIQVTKRARKHRHNLTGDNFYANKLAELRADATNAFRELSGQSPGDVSAMAEMLENVFSANTETQQKVNVGRELVFALRTTWRKAVPTFSMEAEDLFPLSILNQANRGYLVSIGRQMNGCFSAGWYDACAVMMRRLIEVCLIEAFENKSVAHKIKDAQGNYLHLTDLVQRGLAETAWSFLAMPEGPCRNCGMSGTLSAHGRYYHARKDDIEKLRAGLRIVVEEFLYHAGLL